MNEYEQAAKDLRDVERTGILQPVLGDQPEDFSVHRAAGVLTARNRGRLALETLDAIRYTLAVERDIDSVIPMIDAVLKPRATMLRLTRLPDTERGFMSQEILLDDNADSVLGAAMIMQLAVEEVEWALHECGEVCTNKWMLDYVPEQPARERPMANPNKGAPEEEQVLWKAGWRDRSGGWFTIGDYAAPQDAWGEVQNMIVNDLARITLNPEASGIHGDEGMKKEIAHAARLSEACQHMSGAGMLVWLDKDYIVSYEVQE